MSQDGKSLPNAPGSLKSTVLPSRPAWFRMLRATAITIIWFAIGLFILWAIGALYFDVRIQPLRIPLTLIYIASLTTMLVMLRASRWAAILCVLSGVCVMLWWLTLKPTNTGAWQPNVDRTAWVQMHGDRVTIHNLRNCDYHTELDYSNCWSDRTVYLSQLKAADFFLTNWGLTFASHPIVSFQFGENDHIAFSIEARYRPGQQYSTIHGLYRQFGLIFVVADERDVIRLRTNYRKDEEVYLYRLQTDPKTTRAMFLTYVDYLNRLKDNPEWYNELTKNCTTTLQGPLAAAVGSHQSWTYQFILNGSLDELLYDRGRLVTGGLPFPELKQREHINAVAHTVNASPDFSELIRAGRVGF
jgi:hypothetical protein